MGRRTKPEDERLGAIEAVQALASAADKHPAVARLLRDHLDATSVTGTGIGAATGAGTAAATDAALRRAQDDLLDDAWRDLGREQLHELLAGRLSPHEWDSDEAWLDAHASVRRTVWALLRPDDPQTQTWLAGLARWFTAGPKSDRQPSTWLEVSALCLGATPVADLPAIVGRMFHPIRAEYLESYRKLGSLPASPQVSGVMARVSDKTLGRLLMGLTVPLLYRLRHDAAVVEALRASLSGGPVAETAPFFAPSGTVQPGSGQDGGSGEDGPAQSPTSSIALRATSTPWRAASSSRPLHSSTPAT